MMIKVEGLRKEYADLVAVNDISFEIKKGEIFSLLGPNGAGKTTILRIICGLLNPTAGQIKINGMDISTDLAKVKSLMSVVFDSDTVYEDLTAMENMSFAANLYNLPTREAKSRIKELLGLFNLVDQNKLVRNFSKGMKQRLGIARALLPNPQILILDEPTTGLDPQSTVLIRDLILDLKRQGTTVLLTSHNIAEVEKVVDTVAIIDHGELCAYDSYQHLHTQYSDSLKFEIESFALAELLKFVPAEVAVLQSQEENRGIFYVKQLQKFLYCLGDGMGNGLVITKIQQAQLSLEDIFIQLTGRELRD